MAQTDNYTPLKVDTFAGSAGTHNYANNRDLLLL